MFDAVPPTSTVLNAGNHSTHEKRAKNEELSTPIIQKP